MEFEGAVVAIVDGHADDVSRQEIASELDAMEIKSKRAGQHMGERGLANAWHIFDQQVSARENAGERKPDLLFLAEDDAAGLLNDALERCDGHDEARVGRAKL